MSPGVDPGGVITTVHLILRSAHITAGTLVLLCGVAAMSLPNGARWHWLSGNVFFVSMLVLAGTGIVNLDSYDAQRGKHYGRRDNPLHGRDRLGDRDPPCRDRRRVREDPGPHRVPRHWYGDRVGDPRRAQSIWGHFAGYPPVFYFVFSGIAALATALDIRMILRGGLTGTPRLARHLWRMSFAFFGATGSFFFGQPDFVPAIMKETRLYIVAGLLPLGLMIFWLVRVRVRPIQW